LHSDPPFSVDSKKNLSHNGCSSLSPALGHGPTDPLRIARRCAASQAASSYSVMFCLFHMPFGRRSVASQSRSTRRSVAFTRIHSIRGSSLCAASNLRAPLLTLPRSSLAPVRPPMTLHRTGGLSTLGGAYDSSSQSPPDWALELTNQMDRLECHFAFSDPSKVSSTHSPQLPQSDTQPPWILDSGASFHMTPDSTHLDSSVGHLSA
jgi:hypothetical protein